MQTSQSPHETSPREAVQTLRQSLEKTLDQNRVLFSEMARFTKEESMRMAQRNLEHANHAFAHFHEHRNFAGLIGAQQEWMREMMQEYARQSANYSEMVRSLAQGMRAQAKQAVSEFGAEAEETMKDMGEKGEAMVHEASRAAE